MAKANVTAQRLRELLHYDPETGVFTWRVRLSNRVKVGGVAGTVNTWGRAQIAIARNFYYAHRLAWLHIHGEWPAQEIDHIDGDPLNNRIANLRDVGRVTNQQNLRKAAQRNRAGMLGALWHGQNKAWRARIMVDGKSISLGCFKTPEEAHAAYIEAKRRLHKGCTI